MNVRKTEDNPDSTFTPLPTTITPVGLELDPDTPIESNLTSSDSTGINPSNVEKK